MGRARRKQKTSRTSGRWFPSDEYVATFIGSHVLNEKVLQASLGVAQADQVVAAAGDADRVFHAVNVLGIIAGIFDRPASTNLDLADPRGRLGIKLLLVAQHDQKLQVLCPHVNQDRPVWVSCDPPVIVCLACLPEYHSKIVARGFLYDHQCDACGYSTPLIAETMATVGRYLVCGNICPACGECLQEGDVA